MQRIVLEFSRTFWLYRGREWFFLTVYHQYRWLFECFIFVYFCTCICVLVYNVIYDMWRNIVIFALHSIIFWQFIIDAGGWGVLGWVLLSVPVVPCIELEMQGWKYCKQYLYMSIGIYAYICIYSFNGVWLIVAKLGGDVQLVFVAGLSLKLGKSTFRSNVYTDLKPLLHCIG